MPSVRSMIASDAAKYSQLPDRWTKRNSSTGSSAVVRLSTRVYRYRPARCDVRASAASRPPRVPAVTSRASSRTRADSGGGWGKPAPRAPASHAPPPEVREPLGLDHRLLGDLYSHGDRAVGLDLAERSELHAIREAGDHPGRVEPEREGGLPDARDHQEERGRDDERRHRGSEAQPEQVPAETRRRRIEAAHRPLRLDRNVVEHQQPRAQHKEREEHEQVADPEGERRGGDQHEERQERDVAQVAHGATHREAVEEQEEQEAHQAVERRAREVAEVERRGDRGDEHEPAPEPRHRVHAVAERLVPPRRGHRDGGRGAGRGGGAPAPGGGGGGGGGGGFPARGPRGGGASGPAGQGRGRGLRRRRSSRSWGGRGRGPRRGGGGPPASSSSRRRSVE